MDSEREETLQEKQERSVIANEDEDPDDNQLDTPQEQTQIEIPVDEIKKHIKETILSADQIVFEEDLDVIEEVVDVAEEKQRYGIESQTNDLLDELLSTVPNSDRTHTVLNQIHSTIERFKQLREKFSTFDQQGNPIMPVKKLSLIHI